MLIVFNKNKNSPADGTDSPADFVIVTRYPQGVHGAKPTLLMAEEEPVTFSCTSTQPWQTCLWKRPNSDEPCGMFSDDPQKSCSGRWGSGLDNGWIVRQSLPDTCTLSGVTHDMDAGEWSCELRSKPIFNDHYVYEYDQQFFSLALSEATSECSEEGIREELAAMEAKLTHMIETRNTEMHSRLSQLRSSTTSKDNQLQNGLNEVVGMIESAEGKLQHGLNLVDRRMGSAEGKLSSLPGNEQLNYEQT